MAFVDCATHVHIIEQGYMILLFLLGMKGGWGGDGGAGKRGQSGGGSALKHKHRRTSRASACYQSLATSCPESTAHDITFDGHNRILSKLVTR